MNTRLAILLLSATVLLLDACNFNKNISVPANAHWSSGSSTVNGEISVGSDAVVDGSLRTINGRIDLARGATTGNLTSINGNISLAESAHAGDLKTVNGDFTLGRNSLAADLATVNGDIRAANGAHITGSAENINGGMVLCGAQVDGDLSFYNGDVLIADGSKVQGNVTAIKPTNEYQGNPKITEPILIVAPHSVVDGNIKFERPGKLYVSDNATIHGVEGVSPVKFSGSVPTGVRLTACPAN
jgi:hypothetical protein